MGIILILGEIGGISGINTGSKIEEEESPTGHRFENLKLFVKKRPQPQDSNPVPTLPKTPPKDNHKAGN